MNLFTVPDPLAICTPRALPREPASATAGEWLIDTEASWVWLKLTDEATQTSISGAADVEVEVRGNRPVGLLLHLSAGAAGQPLVPR